MKMIIFGLLAALFFFPLTVRADHHEVFIHGVHKLNTSACAVELEIDMDGQNGFEGVDRIELNGVALASLGDSVALTIDSGGHTNAGDHILFASSAFQSQTGLVPDVTFSDAECANFIADTTFEFVIDDPDFGVPPVIIDTLITSSQFGADNTAMTKSSETASPQFVDLDLSTLTVSNNVGSDVIIGVSGGGGGDGGCGLVSTENHRPLKAWLLCFLTLPFLLSARLRQNRS